MSAADPSTVAAISRGSRDAFILLFDRTAAAVRADLAACLLDADRAANVFASTYVEVWWLAGCYSDPGLDAAEWIRHILRRRVADLDDARLQSRRPPTTTESAADPRPSCAELELAALLGRPVAGLWSL